MNETKNKLVDCPACGRINNADWDECRECGTSLSVLALDELSENSKLGLNTKKWGIGIGCVALIAFGAFMTFSSSSAEDALLRYVEDSGGEAELVETDVIESKGPFSILYGKLGLKNRFTGEPMFQSFLVALHTNDDKDEYETIRTKCSDGAPTKKELDEIKARADWDEIGSPIPTIDSSIRYSDKSFEKLDEMADSDGPYTKLQKEAYLKSLVGTQVHYKGEVWSVRESTGSRCLKKYSGFEVLIGCHGKEGYFSVTCFLPEEDKELALSLSKEDAVDFYGYFNWTKSSSSLSFTDGLGEISLTPSIIVPR